jgi:regulator of cell morphogenesis and NO signaling
MVADAYLRVGRVNNFGLEFLLPGLGRNSQRETLASLPERYHLWELPFLCDYIVNNHHTYVEASVPMLRGLLKKAVWHHGEQYAELREAAKAFYALSDVLLQHMMHERSVLFPVITKLHRAQKQYDPISEIEPGTVSQLVAQMCAEHTVAQNAMAKIRALLNDYAVPPHAELQEVFDVLVEFESDLGRQTFIENEILFPRAQKIERELGLV